MTLPFHRLRADCRGCGSTDLERFLELGPTPLANGFLKNAGQAETQYPLDVYLCRRCSLVQLLDVIDAEALFRDYIYVSGTSATMRRHFAGYAEDVVREARLSPGDLVIEAASNDGTLLECFRQHMMKTVGVEPARNIAAEARRRRIETVEEFFSPATAGALRKTYGAARAVLANNVLAHVDEPVDFLRGACELTRPDGWVVVEVPYLAEMLERLEYDTIYHEHLCYFSVTALMHLFERAGLRIRKVNAVPVHGGSLRIFAQPPVSAAEHGANVLEWARRESEAGLDSVERYHSFAASVAENRRRLRDLLCSLRREGKRLAAYGAPAKGNTLLNYCGIGADMLEFTVDQSPLKVGRFTPGSRLPVLGPRALLDRQPDYALLLAWNFVDEVIGQQQEYRDRGGRFVVPVPEPRVV
jgi:SAM-dependent methyltransferase